MGAPLTMGGCAAFVAAMMLAGIAMMAAGPCAKEAATATLTDMSLLETEGSGRIRGRAGGGPGMGGCWRKLWKLGITGSGTRHYARPRTRSAPGRGRIHHPAGPEISSDVRRMIGA